MSENPTTINGLYHALHQLVCLGHGDALALIDTGGGDWGTEIAELIRTTTDGQKPAILISCNKHTDSHELATIDEDLSFLLEQPCPGCKTNDYPKSAMQPVLCTDCVQRMLQGVHHTCS